LRQVPWTWSSIESDALGAAGSVAGGVGAGCASGVAG